VVTGLAGPDHEILQGGDKDESATKLARMTALEAVKEFQKAEVKKKQVRIFQNTKKLMENYNRICQAVEEGIAELSEVPTEEDIEEYSPDDIVIDNILKSKLRSIVMLAHIDRCLKHLEDEQYRKDTHEKERHSSVWLVSFQVEYCQYLVVDGMIKKK